LVDRLLAETAAVLNQSTHPLVRAFGPLPTAAQSREKALVNQVMTCLYGGRLLWYILLIDLID
jgi:hypothetical protein